MNLTEQLRDDLNKFMEKTGVKKTTIGVDAVSDSHIIHRFMKGESSMTLTNADVIYAYMKNYRKGSKNVPKTK